MITLNTESGFTATLEPIDEMFYLLVKPEPFTEESPYHGACFKTQKEAETYLPTAYQELDKYKK